MVTLDWNVARRTASWAGSGPAPAHLAATVEQIRAAAVNAHYLAATTAGFAVTATAPRVLVVDRPGWARANIDTFSHLIDPVLNRQDAGAAPSVWAGMQLGAGLAALGPRVLGQFDPFSGRLFMVAPNILVAEKALRAAAGDFRTWVGIHEQTHALQFAVAPFLADLLRDGMRAILAAVVDRTSSPGAGRWRDRQTGGAADNLPAILRGLLDQPARAWLDRLTGVMALLEGHAEVVMDAVGPQHVPSVATLRAGLARRRSAGRGLMHVVVHRLLGLDAKLAQYARGAEFVRAITASAGPQTFARVWQSAQNLPTWAEIVDPPAWLRRLS